MNGTLKVLIASLAVTGVATGTAFAAKADLDISPGKGDVGDWVFASASGLKSGRYGLFLVGTESPGGSCFGRFGKLHRTDDGHVYLAGKIPRRIRCYSGFHPHGVSARTQPGTYHLRVAVPSGQSGFNFDKTVVERKFRVVRSSDGE